MNDAPDFSFSTTKIAIGILQYPLALFRAFVCKKGLLFFPWPLANLLSNPANALLYPLVVLAREGGKIPRGAHEDIFGIDADGLETRTDVF